MTVPKATPSARVRSVLLVDHRTGRAHALCDLFLRTDPDVTVYYGPGHPAIRDERLFPVPSITLEDVDTVIAFCRTTSIDFVFVSWINALAAGYVDALREAGIAAIGPSRAGAELESSKARGKRFCTDHGVPVASYAVFDDPVAAERHVSASSWPVVVKEDGLTDVSDGAWVCRDTAEAVDAVAATHGRMADDFAVVVEQRLEGVDVSLTGLTDGTTTVLLPPALDYKRAHDGDLGMNCDGMGTIAPHPLMNDRLLEQARSIFDQVLVGLRQEGIYYTGFLYIGAMITDDGLRVLEINTRLGDSEAQALLPGIQRNFTDVCELVLAGRLAETTLELDGRSRCSVAAVQGSLRPDDPLAPPGWPFGAFEAEQVIDGVDDVDAEVATVFLAGADVDDRGRLVTTQGRVLHVSAVGESVAEAATNAYAQLARITFPGLRHRRDIGRLTVGA